MLTKQTHDWEDKYGNRDTTLFDSFTERFRDGRKINDGNYDVSKNRRELRESRANDSGSLRQVRNDDGRGGFQNASYSRGEEKGRLTLDYEKD